MSHNCVISQGSGNLSYLGQFTISNRGFSPPSLLQSIRLHAELNNMTAHCNTATLISNNCSISLTPLLGKFDNMTKASGSFYSSDPTMPIFV